MGVRNGMKRQAQEEDKDQYTGTLNGRTMNCAQRKCPNPP